jgi:hypothetical protein
MIDPRPYLRVIIGISAIGGSISSMESLSLAWAFRPMAPFSSELASLRRPLRGYRRHCEFIFGWPGVLALLALRALLGLACAGLALGGSVPAGIVAAYAGVGALLALRSGYLLDGADRMLLVTAVACCLGSLSPTPAGAAFALFFLAAQLSLAYGTAGLAKLAESAWRNGDSLLSVFSAGIFGRPALHRFAVIHRSKVKFAARAVVLGEIAASLAPWSPPKVAIALLTGAAFFHFAAAAAMGLNTFLFAFPALFPAAIYVSRTLYSH